MMKWTSKVWFLLSIFLVFQDEVRGFGVYNVSVVSQLEDDILNGYKVNARPHDNVTVYLTMTLASVLEMNIVDQTCSISAYLLTNWIDERFQWEPHLYDMAISLYLHVDQIWKPPLYLVNAADGFEIIGDDSNQKSMPVTVYVNGRISWQAPAFLKARCEVDISNFPFDKQTCEFIISTWLYSSNEVFLVSTSQKQDVSDFEENGEWDVEGMDTEYDLFKDKGKDYRGVSFNFILKRKTTYYVLYIIVPVVVFNFVGAVVFTVPPGSGEKLTFSLTMLLSITVLMKIVGDKVPTSSLQLSKLCVYLVVSMMLSVMEVIFTVLILCFYNTSEEDEPVSLAWQFIARNILAPWACRSKSSCQMTPRSIKAKVVPAKFILELPVDQNKVTMCETNADAYKLDTLADDEKPFIYSYRDIAAMMDTLCFVIHLCLSISVTIFYIVWTLHGNV